MDFDQCAEFELGAKPAKGLRLIVNGFWYNDPYYPRPVSEDPRDKALWTIFRDRYLETSTKLGGVIGAAMFITEVEKNGAELCEKIKQQGSKSLFRELRK